MPGPGPGLWLGFVLTVGGLLAVDLGILNRSSRPLTPHRALGWSAGIVLVALLFGLVIWMRLGFGSALEYYTGYLIELTLSVDNLFVFILIFQYFAVPARFQPVILKWGILGAVVMRGIMIWLGAFLFHRFDWIIIVFGGLLVVTGARMFRSDLARVEPECNPVVRLARRFLPLTRSYARQGRFFIRRNGRRIATPLVLVLLMIEWSDLVFAIDSIPAIFAVTQETFLVYSSNIFAVIGLRALYFVLAGSLDEFVYLKPGVAVVLLYVGAKMLASPWVHLPAAWSLGIVLAVLASAMAASLIASKTGRRFSP